MILYSHRSITMYSNYIIVLLIHLGYSFYEDDPWLSPLEIMDVRNDAVSVLWHLPPDVSNQTTWQRLMIAVVRSSLPNSQTSITAKLSNDKTTYTFTNLMGNTTYRASIEAFQDDVSLWYASNMVTTSLAALQWLPSPTDISLVEQTNSTLEVWWTAPVIQETGHNAIINQHLLNVYEFNPTSKQIIKKFSLNVPVPKTSFAITRLSPASVYNVTLQAGTSYGYGNLAWSVFSTLPSSDDVTILKLSQKTPNSLTLSWPQNWLSTPSARFTIRAKTLHSPDGVDKEIQMSGMAEPGRPSQFVLRNLHPGSTYNVSITTTVTESPSTKLSGKWAGPARRKTAWSVFSTLTQGEYAVGEPRIVVETETAVSIVFQPLKQLGDVAYQMRYVANDGSKHIETPAYTEIELVCPKFGCDWLCALVFNLNHRPRDYTFEIRAKVDEIWNKWIPIARRPWNLLERVCSINPPSSPVENIGNREYQREIEIGSARRVPALDPWRYLVVVDSRQADFSAIDISKLADRATAEMDHIPYYIAGSLSPQQVDEKVEFRLGDGGVRGGYLNYPLREMDFDPRWTLVPLSHSENEIMEPRLKTCGFTEEGRFDCDMSVSELASHFPLWAQATAVLLLIVLVFCVCVVVLCLLRRYCGKSNGLKESSVMYYHNDSPNTTMTTREYRRVERREFKPSDMEERMRFLENE